MDFSLIIPNEDFVLNNNYNSLADDDLAYIQKDHLNFSNDNLGQSFVNGWSRPLIMTDISYHNRQSLIPLMPNQNPFNRSFVPTQNLPLYNSLMAQTPSKYPKTNTFEEISQVFNQKKNKKVAKINQPLKKCNIKKGKWSNSENLILRKLVDLYGIKKWESIANILGRRDGKQCRERWHNHLRPGIKIDAWSEKEDQILVEAHKVCGNKWAKIALKLPGRTENAIKNRWYARKRQVQLMKTNESDENEKPLHNNILGNYIRHVTINNDPHKANETSNTKDDDDDDDDNVLDEETNLSMDVTMQTTEPLANVSTTSGYVPEPTTFLWDYDITGICEPMDDTQMFIQGWD